MMDWTPETTMLLRLRLLLLLMHGVILTAKKKIMRARNAMTMGIS